MSTAILPRLPVASALAAEDERLARAEAAAWLWEPAGTAVVLGLSGSEERDLVGKNVRADGLPVLRRRSGGGTVLLAPGVLCFGLVLPRDAALPVEKGATPAPRALARSILAPLAAALGKEFGLPARVAGLGDLAVGDRKLCGTAQKWTARAVLFHGSLLVSLDLALFERYLKPPPRAPEYRRHRTHADFCTTLAAALGRAISPAEAAEALAPALGSLGGKGMMGGGEERRRRRRCLAFELGPRTVKAVVPAANC